MKLLEPLARALGVSLVELMEGRHLETEALPMEEAEQVVSRAMDRSQRATARRYLKLLSALLIGIGVLCLLRLIPTLFLLPVLLRNQLWAAGSSLIVMGGDYGVIGGADGPTAILTSSPFPWWDLWVAPAVAAVGLILCIVLAVKVIRLTRKMK